MKGAVNNFPDKMKSFFSLGFLLSFVFTAILFIFAGLINREFSNDFLITSPQFILLTISPELSIFFPYRIGSNLIVIGVLMGFIVSSVFILRSNTCNSIRSEQGKTRFLPILSLFLTIFGTFGCCSPIYIISILSPLLTLNFIFLIWFHFSNEMVLIAIFVLEFIIFQMVIKRIFDTGSIYKIEDS